MGLFAVSQAQTLMAPAADTTTNADTVYLVSPKLTSSYDVVTVQLNVTKISGTVAGNAEIQASLDGVNYSTVAEDTLTLTNGNSSKIWALGRSDYLYYRVRVATSGTQSSAARGIILYRKQ